MQTEAKLQSEDVPLVSSANLEFKQWLTVQVSLPQYYDNFVQNGYSSLTIIKCIESKDELAEIGVKLRGHQSKIMSEINKLKHADSNIATAPPQIISTQPVTAVPPSEIQPPHQPVPSKDATEKKMKIFRIIAFSVGAIASLMFFIGLCANTLAKGQMQFKLTDEAPAFDLEEYDIRDNELVCTWTHLSDSDGDFKSISYADICGNQESYWKDTVCPTMCGRDDDVCIDGADEEDVGCVEYLDKLEIFDHSCVTMGVAFASLIILIIATLLSIAGTTLVQPFYKFVDIESLILCEGQTNPPRALFISAAVLGWVSLIVWVAGDATCMSADGIEGALGTSMVMAIIGSIAAMIAAPFSKY